MNIIKPFKGICYNAERIVDLSRVVCPPYDVIGEQEQDFYYHQSPFNFIRLILNKKDPSDNENNNRYKRAATFLNEWLKTQILCQDKDAAIYFYKQDFFINGQEYSRLGFIALMQIQDASAVLPHENTHHAPKMDRWELMQHTRGNLTPIFTVFSDKRNVVKNIFADELSKRNPDFCLKDTQAIRHSVWRISDNKLITTITDAAKTDKIFIADGHHRYEVASMYRKHMQENDADYTPEKSYNFIMTYFTALESEGLSILPVHRVIKQAVAHESLSDDFSIKKLASLLALEETMGAAPKNKCVFGLLTHAGIFLLMLKDKQRIFDSYIVKKCFRDFDIAVIDTYVVAELLKIDKRDIIYTTTMSEAKNLLEASTGAAAFIVRATTIQQIKNVALSGERMPPKSTFFYPKLLSGLVLHLF